MLERKLKRTVSFFIAFLMILLLNPFVFASDLDGNNSEKEEIENAIVLLEEEQNKLEILMRLVNSFENNAQSVGFSEEDMAIKNCASICFHLNSKVIENKQKLKELQEKLEEYKLYDNMEYIGNFKLTGYCPCEKCCGKSPSNPGYGITARGTRATEGVTVAMDGRYPFGTRVYIEGVGIRVVEDRGGSIKGNHIDVFCNKHADCFSAQYNTTAKVYIIRD